MKVLKQTNKAPEGMDPKAWNVIKKTLNKNLQNYPEVLYSSWSSRKQQARRSNNKCKGGKVKKTTFYTTLL